jgi:transglutaminase-like putative cysteine protease
MWLTVEHTTRFAYDAPIAEAYTELRLKPAHRDGQRCSSFTLTTVPAGRAVAEYVDRFGNDVRHFDLQGAHDEVVVTARSEVWTAASFPAGAEPPTLLDTYDFLRPSTFVAVDGEVAALARDAVGGAGAGSGPGARPGAEREAALALMQAVADRLVYDPDATHVFTPGMEALARGRGVCQDFSHVLIGACRSQGLLARYVSGYLLDPDLGDGRSESHAWVDVFTKGHGWLSLDPTHRCEQNERYVRVATGRDYADVPPTRGVYKGNASERLEVAVTLRVL